MDNNYLLISELAKLFDVTTHTLRFYEEKGLIEPCARTEKGYRLYNFDAITRLEEILLFRSLGMPIEDLVSYFDHKNSNAFKQHLVQLESRIDQSIAELLAQKQSLEDSKKLFEQYESHKNDFFIQNYSERYLLFLDHIDEIDSYKINEKQFLSMVNSASNGSKIRASKDLHFLFTERQLDLYLHINPMDLRHFKTDALRKLPATSYLCCFHECVKEHDFTNLLYRAGQYLKKHRLKSDHFAIDVYSSDYTVLDYSPDLSLLQIPLL